MGQFTFDEREGEHLYVCLKEGQKAFAKQRKGAESLGLPTDEIEELLEINRQLRQAFNPRAEEEAREAARKKRGDHRDPRQLEIPVEVGGRKAERADASPNGQYPKKERAKKVSTATVVDGLDVVNPDKTQEPDDDFLIAQLRRAGVDVPQGVVDLWTSSEREVAIEWAAACAKDPEFTPPMEVPPFVWKALWAGQYDFDPRAATPTAAGVKDGREFFDGWREYWIDVGPFRLYQVKAQKRTGIGKWEVRSAEGGKIYSGPNEAKAHRVTIERNRAAAVSKLLTDMRDRRIAAAKGDAWTSPKPPKVDDVGADKVHTAIAKEAR